MRLVQFYQGDDPSAWRVAVVSADEEKLQVVAGCRGTYDLAMTAVRAGKQLAEIIAEKGFAEEISYPEVLAEGRLLAPLTHPDPAPFEHRAGVTPYTSTYVLAECCVFGKQSGGTLCCDPLPLHPQGFHVQRAHLIPKLRC